MTRDSEYGHPRSSPGQYPLSSPPRNIAPSPVTAGGHHQEQSCQDFYGEREPRDDPSIDLPSGHAGRTSYYKARHRASHAISLDTTRAGIAPLDERSSATASIHRWLDEQRQKSSCSDGNQRPFLDAAGSTTAEAALPVQDVQHGDRTNTEHRRRRHRRRYRGENIDGEGSTAQERGEQSGLRDTNQQPPGHASARLPSRGNTREETTLGLSVEVKLQREYQTDDHFRETASSARLERNGGGRLTTPDHPIQPPDGVTTTGDEFHGADVRRHTSRHYQNGRRRSAARGDHVPQLARQDATLGQRQQHAPNFSPDHQPLTETTSRQASQRIGARGVQASALAPQQHGMVSPSEPPTPPTSRVSLSSSIYPSEAVDGTRRRHAPRRTYPPSSFPRSRDPRQDGPPSRSAAVSGLYGQRAREEVSSRGEEPTSVEEVRQGLGRVSSWFGRRRSGH